MNMVAEPRRLQQLWAVNSPLRHKADTGKVLSAVLCVLNRATKKEKLKKIALKATCDDRMKRTVRGGHVDNIVDKLVRRAQAAATTMSSPRACGSPSSGMAATRRRLGDTPTVVTGAVPTVEAPLDTPGRSSAVRSPQVSLEDIRRLESDYMKNVNTNAAGSGSSKSARGGGIASGFSLRRGSMFRSQRKMLARYSTRSVVCIRTSFGQPHHDASASYGE